MLKFIKAIAGVIAIIGIALGIACLEVWLIPLRGTVLAFIVLWTCCPLAGFGGLLWIAWVYSDEEEEGENATD